MVRSNMKLRDGKLRQQIQIQTHRHSNNLDPPAPLHRSTSDSFTCTLPVNRTSPAMAQQYGTKSHTSPNLAWRITTRKEPILKAEPIEALSNDIGIPIPEMIFGDNYVAVTHLPTQWTLDFNARDALDRVSKNEEGMLQVAVAEEWKKDRRGQLDGNADAVLGLGVKGVVKPFDWSYSTDYAGTTHAKNGTWRLAGKEEVIRTDLLSRQDPILFFDAVDLYEDELADNGTALVNIKVRMMPERLLVLSRFFLRLDGVIVRIRDTRVYVEHSGKKIVRQYTAKEEKYEVLKKELETRRENVPEAFRDAALLAPMLRTVEDKVEVFEVD